MRLERRRGEQRGRLGQGSARDGDPQNLAPPGSDGRRQPAAQNRRNAGKRGQLPRARRRWRQVAAGIGHLDLRGGHRQRCGAQDRQTVIGRVGAPRHPAHHQHGHGQFQRVRRGGDQTKHVSRIPRDGSGRVDRAAGAGGRTVALSGQLRAPVHGAADQPDGARHRAGQAARVCRNGHPETAGSEKLCPLAGRAAHSPECGRGLRHVERRRPGRRIRLRLRGPYAARSEGAGRGGPARHAAAGDGLRARSGRQPGCHLPGLRVRAYAAYLLTRQMNVSTPMIASIRESLDKRFPKVWQDDPAAAYLAAAYLLQKQDKLASELADRQVAHLVKRPTGTRADSELYYVDPLAEDAQTLYILARHFPARAKALPPEAMTGLVKALAENRYNTLSAAWLTLAFDAYAGAVGEQAVGKLGIVEVDAKGAKKALALPANLMPRAPFTAGSSKLLFSNDSGVPAYFAVTETGYDRAPPAAELREGMEVVREFVDAAGKAVTKVTVGDEVTVRLKFRAVGRSVYNVALVDLMPGGFEPVLETAAPPAPEEGAEPQEGDKAPAQNADGSHPLPGLAGSRTTWAVQYADVREDRVVFYGSVTGEAREVTYKVN